MKPKDYEIPLTTNVGMQMYRHVITALTESAWVITPTWLDQIHGIVGRKMQGIELSADILGEMDYSHEVSVTAGSAVIPVQGPLFKKANLMTQYSGATSMELTAKDFRKALSDDDVKSIVLHIDSPGGTIDGTKEFADLIYSSRGIKPITAYVDGMAASAAYWIASAADKIVVSSETALVGSVGVIAAHYDYSKLYEGEGVKKTYIYQGKYKGMGRETEALSGEAKALIQGEIDGLYEIFIDSVAKNLDVSSKDALAITDDSRVFNGKEGLERGLIHEIGTLEGILKGGGDEDNTALTQRGQKTSSIKPEETGKTIKTLENKKEADHMNAEEIRSKFPDAVRIIETDAVKGMVSQDGHDAVVKERDDAVAKVGELEVISKVQKDTLAEQKIAIAVVEAKGNEAAASGIQDDILTDSALPEKSHADVKGLIDFKGYVKEDEPFTAQSESGKSFAADFTTKVKGLEKSLDLSREDGVGTGDSRDDGDGGSSEADAEIGRDLARATTGKIRSDEK